MGKSTRSHDGCEQKKANSQGKGKKTTTIKAGKNHKHICYVAKTKKKRREFHHLLRKAPTVVEGIRETTSRKHRYKGPCASSTKKKNTLCFGSTCVQHEVTML